ncbi:laccase-2 [Pyricularia oryzae]|uniref:Laccase-2 n=2 Tax=Pyricularia oryzae TaxID=318829 RepID=A0AA97PAI9_PYRO3|nr:laccase-2 [Pyricularia oryzae Y34]KAI7911413.1 laccase-2 [Pyricularia oryzae]KAI7912274.1 laccase-2 [Pyricularia oryzae]
MDPESRARDEREELLAADDPDHDVPSKEDEEGLLPRRPAPPGRRLGSSIAMLLLVAFSLVLLGGAALSGMVVMQTEPAAPPSPPAADDPAKAKTPEESGKSGILPAADAFDLRKTNFFVTDQDAQMREYEFNITRVEVEGPDGVKKSMVLVNGQSPGPLIEANSGDLVKVVVHNSMPGDERTTIHWHGIDQRDSVQMDGVWGVTQCGIPPGESYTYVFGVPQQRGTFWYHAHVSVQYTDGLYGPMIIHDPTEKVPQVEEDRIIMIGDMHHMDGRQAVKEYLSPSSSWSPGMSGMEPYPDNIIINGRNVFNCSQPEEGEEIVGKRHEGEEMKCASGTRFNSRIKSNTAARLRIISHSSNTPMWFTVDNHTLEIVEMDGVEVEPVATTKIFINPGQRYSAILRANQTAGNYLMRAIATCAMLDPNPHSNFASVNSQGTAILSYDDVDAAAALIGKPWDLGAFVASKDVGTEPWHNRCSDLPFDLTKPMRPIDAYEVGDKNRHYFMFRFVDDGKGVQRTSINETIFTRLDNEATIWQVPDFDETSAAASSANSTIPLGGVFQPSQHVLYSADETKGAEIAISAGNMMSHPWHLHGQQFQIVGWGRGEFGRSKTTWNLANPTRRDTVTVPGHSHVVIRYKADNPGVWALHCHIQWHAEGGMFMQTAQRVSALKKLIDGMGAQGTDDVRHKFCKQPGKS